jgi:hypothetical protein
MMKHAEENDVTFGLEPIPNNPKVFVGKLVISHEGKSYECATALGRYPETNMPILVICTEIDNEGDFKLMYVRRFLNGEWKTAREFAYYIECFQGPVLADDLEMFGFELED